MDYNEAIEKEKIEKCIELIDGAHSLYKTMSEDGRKIVESEMERMSDESIKEEVNNSEENNEESKKE